MFISNYLFSLLNIFIDILDKISKGIHMNVTHTKKWNDIYRQFTEIFISSDKLL